MKKKFMLLIIATIMMVTFVSCESDIFQSISDFMGVTSTNVLLDGEIVSVPTGNIDALGGTLGGTLEDPVVPVTPAKAAEVRDSVEKILKSQGETEAAKGILEDPVAPADVPDDVEQAMEDLEDELGLVRGDLEVDNKGKLAAAILLADLKKKKDAFVDPANPTPAEKEALVKDARIVIDLVKKISPIGDLDVTTALTGMLEDLMRSRVARRMASRGVEDDFDFDDALGYIKPLFNMYFTLMDTNPDPADVAGVISPGEVKKIAVDYAPLRKAYETMASSLEGSGQETKLSDLVNYLSATGITANNELIPATVAPTTFATIINLVKTDLINNPDATIPDPDGVGSDWYFLKDEFRDDWIDSFFTYLEVVPAATGLPRYRTIFDTVLAISGAIPDNDFIHTEIQNTITYLETQIAGRP